MMCMCVFILERNHHHLRLSVVRLQFDAPMAGLVLQKLMSIGESSLSIYTSFPLFQTFMRIDRLD